MNRRPQAGNMFMAQTGKRRVNRADHKLHAALFQRQHLRIAKRLRDYWVSGVKVTKPHSLRLLIADCRLPIGLGFHVILETAQPTLNPRRPVELFRLNWALDVGRSMFSAFTKSERPCPDPSRNRALANLPC